MTEVWVAAIVCAVILILDFFPKRKSRGRRGNVVYLVLCFVSMAALVWAFTAQKLPTLTTPLLKLFGPFMGG